VVSMIGKFQETANVEKEIATEISQMSVLA
jgi:hypothetical protein